MGLTHFHFERLAARRVSLRQWYGAESYVTLETGVDAYVCRRNLQRAIADGIMILASFRK